MAKAASDTSIGEEPRHRLLGGVPVAHLPTLRSKQIGLSSLPIHPLLVHRHLFRSTRRGLGPRSSRIRGFARWHVANLTRDEMQTVRKTPISSRCALAHHLRRRWPDLLREAGTAHATAAILRVGHTTGACMFQSRAGMAGFIWCCCHSTHSIGLLRPLFTHAATCEKAALSANVRLDGGGLGGRSTMRLPDWPAT